MEEIFVNTEKSLNGFRPERPHIVRSEGVAGAFALRSGFISTKLVLQGAETYSGAFGQNAINTGRFLMVSADQDLRVEIRPGTRGFCAYFSTDHIYDLLREELNQDVPFSAQDNWVTALPLEGSPLGRALFLSATTNSKLDHDYCCKLIAENLVSFSKTSLVLPFQKISTRYNVASRLEMIRLYIEANDSRRLTLDQLASLSCMSRHNLNRYFAMAYGAPPIRYWQNLKLDKCKTMLLSGKSIRETAETAGFSCISSFSRAYLRRHGQRPGKHRPK